MLEEIKPNPTSLKLRGTRKSITKIILLVLLIVLILLSGYFAFSSKSNEVKNNRPENVQNLSNNNQGGGNNQNRNNNNNFSNSDISWQLTSDGSYQASGTPPECSSPLVLASPTDLSKVISILYPGQTRGGDYKPHGGFRFTDGLNQVEVKAPMDAAVVEGGRYLVNGEIQYVFDFVNSCGIKYRIGHLRTLSPAFENIANQFPEAQEMDSRTTQVIPNVEIKAGDIIATAVGLLEEGNAFFDFGVYDLRQENEASKDTTFQTEHTNDKGQAWHGVCWFDLLSAQDETIVKGLPATSPGSESDYCK
jgi:hypothetical protein